MNRYYIGYDIGGTKCAVLLGAQDASGGIAIADKIRFETKVARGWQAVVAELLETTRTILAKNALAATDIAAAGVSCGGPLNSRTGTIHCPPNLPDWDGVPICAMVREAFGFPCALQNDANACALAEWRFGAGRGMDSLIFLTFGTGMGAGLILDGRLYSGASDMAGEVGHIRLAQTGPVGYGKAGSFEGFCSGGGIARLAMEMAEAAIRRGEAPSFCASLAELEGITAQTVAKAAIEGDALAVKIYNLCGERLGEGLALLMDILNPEAIVIGSIYARAGDLLEESMRRAIAREALTYTSESCRILKAELGDAIGDYAALGVAMQE